MLLCFKHSFFNTRPDHIEKNWLYLQLRLREREREKTLPKGYQIVITILSLNGSPGHVLKGRIRSIRQLITIGSIAMSETPLWFKFEVKPGPPALHGDPRLLEITEPLLFMRENIVLWLKLSLFLLSILNRIGQKTFKVVPLAVGGFSLRAF